MLLKFKPVAFSLICLVAIVVASQACFAPKSIIPPSLEGGLSDNPSVDPPESPPTGSLPSNNAPPLTLGSPIGSEVINDCLGGSAQIVQNAFVYKRLRANVYTGPDDPNSSQRYTTTPMDINLRLYINYPPGFPFATSSARLPTVVMFHGGGWTVGSPTWWMPFAHYLASRGIIVVNVQYRLMSRFKPLRPNDGALEATRDAVSVMRWLRKFGDQLKIDTARMGTFGDSAGGHLALATSMVGSDISDENLDDSRLSASANLIFAAYPVTNTENLLSIELLGNGHYGIAQPPTVFSNLPQVSPLRLLRSSLPPTVIVHSAFDTSDWTSQSRVQEFSSRAAAVTGDANRVQLLTFDGIIYPGAQEHGFLAYDASVPATEAYGAGKLALARLDWALQQQGWLSNRGSLANTQTLVNSSNSLCTEIATSQFSILMNRYGYADGPANSGDLYWRLRSVW